jgi:hypothetical protein
MKVKTVGEEGQQPLGVLVPFSASSWGEQWLCPSVNGVMSLHLILPILLVSLSSGLSGAPRGPGSCLMPHAFP